MRLALSSSEPSPLPPAEPQPLPRWAKLGILQVRAVREGLVLLGLVAALAIAWQLRTVVLPALLALLLAHVAEPVLDRLAERWNVPRVASSLALVAVVFGTFALVAFVGLPRLAEDLVELSDRLPGLARSLGVPPRAIDRLQSLEGRDVLARAGSVVSVASAVLGATATALISLIFAAALFVFISVEIKRLPSVGPYLPRSKRDALLEFGDDLLRIFGGFLRGQLVVALFTTIGFAIGFSLLGVPYALIAASVGGLLSFIPNGQASGWLLAMLFASFESIAQGEGVVWERSLLYPTLVYFVTQSLETFVVTPLVQGELTQLHPLAVIAALIAGGSLGGLLGIFLAIPVAATLKIAGTKWLLPAWRRRMTRA